MRFFSVFFTILVIKFNSVFICGFLVWFQNLLVLFLMLIIFISLGSLLSVDGWLVLPLLLYVLRWLVKI